MSAMDKMWLSFYAMGFMAISMGLIYASRYKLKNRIIKSYFRIHCIFPVTNFFYSNDLSCL